MLSKSNLWCQELFQGRHLSEIAKLFFGNCRRSVELWARALEKPAPEMDFEKYVVACVFLGYEADWLYSIGFGQPVLRDHQMVIEYGLHQVMLRLSGPFRAGGQYHMKVFEKAKNNVPMILEETGPTSRRKK